MKKYILLSLIILNSLCHSQNSVGEDWVLHFPPVLDYENYTIYKMTKDNNGNLFLISIKNLGGGSYKWVIIKIIMNNWVVEWVTELEVVDYSNLIFTDLATDYQGNIYAVGLGYNASSNSDFITTKYNSSGKQLWVETYNGAMNSSDWINDLYIDTSGNVYVTGASGEFTQPFWNATTIKYNTDGIMQWKNTYVDSSIYDEEGKAVIADNSSNVYIFSDIYTTSRQYLTIKYNSSGVEEWARIDGTSGNDYAQFIGLDNSKKIIVGGTAYDPNSPSHPLSYLIYKFNPDGSYAAGNNYNSNSVMRGMKVSPLGNVYVTGEPSYTGNQSSDIITVKFNSSINFQWEKHFDYAQFDRATDIIFDLNENIFVTGYSTIPSVQAFAITIKYNSNGDSLWANIYTHQNIQNNSASGIVQDESGNSFVIINYYSTSQGQEIIKLNNGGVYQWAYNYKTFCQPASVNEDTKGNIYLTGTGGLNQSMWDYITMKCDSSGNIIWIKTYDGPANGTDQATDLEIDQFGNVYVTGGSNGNGTDYDFATIKYDSSGNEQWAVRYNGPAFGSDISNFINVDQNGNVYVSGSSINSNSTFDIATIKYNNLGQLQWVNRYNGTADGNDLSQGLEIDQSGNVFISGTSDSSGALYDYVTVKYNSSGNTEWVKRYNGPANDGDLVSATSLDNSGNVYVTGWSFGTTTNSDYATVKYNSAGDELWSARWDDPASSFDYANDIAVDENGNAFVTGISNGMGTDNDYTTVKYNSFGEQQWAVPYNGQTNGSDVANNIALDYLGDVYVTGHTDNNTQYSTIKYNKQGSLQWEINYDFINFNDSPTEILVDNAGNVFVTGYSNQAGEEWIWSIVKYKQPGFIPSEVEEEHNSPSDFVLYQNYPNPFNPTTTLSFVIGQSSFVTLKVYDILGREVETLVNEEKPAGNYETEFDVSQLSSGIYFYRLTADKFSETKKMIFLK